MVLNWKPKWIANEWIFNVFGFAPIHFGPVIQAGGWLYQLDTITKITFIYLKDILLFFSDFHCGKETSLIKSEQDNERNDYKKKIWNLAEETTCATMINYIHKYND